MNFYSSTILLTELLMIAMTIHVLNYSGFTKDQKRWFILTFVSIMICAGAEFCVHCGYYSPKFALPLTVITAIQFSLAPMLGVFFLGALGVRDKIKTASAVFGVNIGCEIAMAPFGKIFYFNDQGYFRGEWFLIYEAFYIVSLVYLVVGLFIVGRRFQHRDRLTIGMLVLVIVAGIMPMTLYRVNVTYTAIAMGACICYIYYNDLVQQDIKDALIAHQEKISGMQEHIITGLATLIESRDMDTGEHITRTGALVKKLSEDARADGVYTETIDDRFISLMTTLAPMHDIGKIVVPDSILKKPARLTIDEYEIMKKHAAAGGKVVREVLNGITDESYVSFAADIATYHHERWDGKGYPMGLKETQIPLSARIMAIADVYDALISERCYKAPIPPEMAFKIIEDEAGSHFDPLLAKVFLSHKEEFMEI